MQLVHENSKTSNLRITSHLQQAYTWDKMDSDAGIVSMLGRVNENHSYLAADWYLNMGYLATRYFIIQIIETVPVYWYIWNHITNRC